MARRRRPRSVRMSIQVPLSLWLAAAVLTLAAADAAGQGAGRRGAGTPPRAPALEEPAAGFKELDSELVGAFFPQRARLEAMKARGFFPTGLAPVYPTTAKCPEIDSPFAARTRGDGSARATQFFHGFHGGIDISVPEGTPVLAVAAGTVVHKTPGHSIGGIGVVLQHAPADTGLGVWTYTEYKHLRELPALEIGRRVAAGEPIAVSGKTGTQGGHYGPSGHPHLHLSALWSGRADYTVHAVLVPADGHWMDPIALFRGPPVDSPSIAALPAAGKRVPVPYTAGGALNPAGTRTVWPLACAPR